MIIKYLCPYWGQENTSANEFIDKVIQAGYDGIEVNVPDNHKFEKELCEAVANNNLKFVGQQWLAPKKETVDQYIVRMENLLYKRAALNPLFINSHTGKDYFSFEENCKVIDKCNEISKKTGVEIRHETHRGRFNFCAELTSKYLDKYPNLELTADFSHWTTVSESLLEDQQESLNQAIYQSKYIHARVGYCQSPQVNNPFAPENKIYLDAFVSWWRKIIKVAEESDQKEFFICPEFGPSPYMPNHPFTNKPIEDQWELNRLMMEYLKEHL